MPTSEAKSTANEPATTRVSNGPLSLSYPQDDQSFEENALPEIEENQEAGDGGRSSVRRGAANSRWVDYDTHELLQMISELEDERRWARLREGIWIALLFHIAVLLAAILLPKYVFMPRVIDPFDAIKQRKDLTYLDLPPDVLRKLQAKPKVPVTPEQKQPRVDRKTLEALNKPAPPPPTAELPPQPTTPTPQPALTAPTPKIEPAPQPAEAPHPQAVPARPNFALGSANPADQLRDAMRGARGAGPGASQVPSGPGQMPMHPGAGGGVQVLSDMQGVDFSSWLLRWHRETERTWDPLIPDEVNPPIMKRGAVQIRFKIAPNGRVVDGSMKLEGMTGDTALARAAWGAITGSNYPPLPHDFHGPYLELRATFYYNMEPGQ